MVHVLNHHHHQREREKFGVWSGCTTGEEVYPTPTKDEAGALSLLFLSRFNACQGSDSTGPLQRMTTGISKNILKTVKRIKVFLFICMNGHLLFVAVN